jgi:hypothetical protein
MVFMLPNRLTPSPLTRSFILIFYSTTLSVSRILTYDVETRSWCILFSLSPYLFFWTLMPYSKANLRNNGEKTFHCLKALRIVIVSDKIFLMRSLLLVSFEYILFCLSCLMRIHSIVCIVTGYRLDDRGVGVPVGSRILFSTLSRPALGFTQPPIKWAPRALSPG